MILPLSTDRPLKRPTVVNHALIGANVLVYLGGLVAERVSPGWWARVVDAMALDPAAPTVWAFATYQFVHGGFMHILANMLFLYVFGPNVEDRFTRWGYAAFYVVGGAAAGGTHILFEDAPVIGASGSIAAVTGAFLVLFPKTHVRTLFFLFFIGVIEIPASWFIGFAIAKDVVFQGLNAQGGVALLAHIGGYAFGLGVSLTLLATGALAREPYDLFSIGRQAHRRRVFREITSKGRDPWRAGLAKEGPVARRNERAPEDTRAMEARAEVSRLFALGDASAAAEAYKRMVAAFGPVPLSARVQVGIANELHQQGDHAAAARAYEQFLERHGTDGEAARVRLMLGLLYARYLGEPAKARALLEQARSAVGDAEQRELAASLLGELG